MTPSGPTPAAQSDTAQSSDTQTEPVTEAEAATPAEGTEETEETEPTQTLLEQMGGVSGLVYSSVPVLVFVAVYLPTHSLAAGIWASVASAVAILAWRLIRKEPIQPAISGLFGVAIAAFIAYRTGSARGYFLFGIWTSLAYGGAFLLSMLVRWPLAGVVWSTLNGTGTAWRADPQSRRYYDVATAVWVLVFGARFIVQHWLYSTNQVGWLAFTRIAMGWPLTALAALVTVWAVRKADVRAKILSGDVDGETAAETAEATPHDAAVTVAADQVVAAEREPAAPASVPDA
jgi:hypothetical protein